MIPPFEAEAQIRAATVAAIRNLIPTARIIHELNVEQGIVRADIAAVTHDRLYLFELKSAKDTLHRLGQQIRHFLPVCHGLVVVADNKWCGPATSAGYPNCDVRKVIANSGRCTLWEYPEVERPWGRDWRLSSRPNVPWHHHMLRLLWVDELKNIARDNGLPANTKTTGQQLCRDLALTLTGSEIDHAVCAALRQRQFAHADAPAISEVQAA